MTIPREDHAIPTLALCGRSLAWRSLAWRSLAWRSLAWRSLAWRSFVWRSSAEPSLRPLPHHGPVDPPAAMATDPAARSAERRLPNLVWGRVRGRASDLPEF